MRSSLRFTGAIASAVVGEVHWLEYNPEFLSCEGIAYKAAWHRAGSDIDKHCEAHRRDCLIASLFAAHPGVCVRSLIAGHVEGVRP